MRSFDLGGIGVHTSTRPFDIEQPPIVVYSTRLFDISGVTFVTSTRPFDIEGDLSLYSTRPFDIIESIPSPLPGTVIPGPEETETSTLTAPAAAGTSTITVGGTWQVGQIIRVGREYRRIVDVS